jgi:uncharacterized protein YbjT (DUF2867 family)
MMTENKTALIAGATGLVGSSLLQQLLAESYYSKIIVLLRKPINIKDSRLVQLIVDFNNLEKYANELKANDVFCTLGTTIKKAGSKEAFRKVDYEYPVKLASITHKNGAEKYIIVTAIGADANSLIFYNKVKGETEEKLKSLQLKHLYILQPSLLTGDRKEHRTGEKIAIMASNYFNHILLGPLRKYRSINANVVAFGMIYAAKHFTEKMKTVLSDEIQEIYNHNQPKKL